MDWTDRCRITHLTQLFSHMSHPYECTHISDVVLHALCTSQWASHPAHSSASMLLQQLQSPKLHGMHIYETAPWSCKLQIHLLPSELSYVTTGHTKTCICTHTSKQKSQLVGTTCVTGTLASMLSSWVASAKGTLSSWVASAKGRRPGQLRHQGTAVHRPERSQPGRSIAPRGAEQA